MEDKVITIRIDQENFKDLQEIEKEERTDRAAITRKLLAFAIKEWKIKNSLNLVRESKVTIRKAAKLAGCSYVEFLNYMENEGISLGYSLEDLKVDWESK
ncbi:UPF0175 family protein [Candidatus Pacearchaeota archaeon]|nr:UPF0175 family protein [Candidatus Pacearchaeota archaeon]